MKREVEAKASFRILFETVYEFINYHQKQQDNVTHNLAVYYGIKLKNISLLSLYCCTTANFLDILEYHIVSFYFLKYICHLRENDTPTLIFNISVDRK